MLRDFLLESRGWRVVSLPYFEINSAASDAKLQAYLARVLSIKAMCSDIGKPEATREEEGEWTKVLHTKKRHK